jgi:DNA helicase II / ATP-dependent DNA helicase PcrA
VDEVFDANDLDITVIEMAIDAGVAVTLVGDPWQALYVFRGARPDLVSDVLSRTGVRSLQLTQSFRWRNHVQRNLADRLRASASVALDRGAVDGIDTRADVVLSLVWKRSWEVGDHVLPLAFHTFKGGTEEAAATLLLNHVTRNIFSEDATYLSDALTALAISDPDVPRQLEPGLQEVVDLLKAPGRLGLNTAYARLVALIAEVSPRYVRAAHHAHTGRLDMIAKRVGYLGRPIPGLTTHQAKGREWDDVGVRLSDTERAALAAGLSVHEDTHRQLYVACTRARRFTIEI